MSIISCTAESGEHGNGHSDTPFDQARAKQKTPTAGKAPRGLAPEIWYGIPGTLKQRDNAGLGTKQVLPNTCHWLRKELENHCSSTGAGLLQAENVRPCLMPQAQGIQGVVISDTLSQTHAWCSFSNDSTSPARVSLVLPEIEDSWDAGQGSNLPLAATGRLKLVPRVTEDKQWTSEGSISRTCS